MSNSCHCEVHTYLCAFALEVSAETFDDFFAYALSYAEHVLCCPSHFFVPNFNELLCGSLAKRASLGGIFAFNDLTAN
jgi:hypothetical protein